MGDKNHLEESDALRRIRAQVIDLQRRCEAHAESLEASADVSAEPGLTPRENLELVVRQLRRVADNLGQLETAYASHVFDVMQARETA